MIKKFPVTSNKGEEFLVTARYYNNIIGSDVLEIELFKVIKNKLMFINFNNEKRLFSYDFYKGESTYNDPDKEYYNILKAVKNTIYLYYKSKKHKENESFRTNESQQLVKETLKEFELWDGKIK